MNKQHKKCTTLFLGETLRPGDVIFNVGVMKIIDDPPYFMYSHNEAAFTENRETYTCCDVKRKPEFVSQIGRKIRPVVPSDDDVQLILVFTLELGWVQLWADEEFSVFERCV